MASGMEAANTFSELAQARDTPLERFLVQYSNDDWVCYWDGSYGAPRDPETTFVFRPDLSQTRNGFICTEELAGSILQAAPEAEVTAAADRLLQIQTQMEQMDVWCTAYCSESDYLYVPLLLPWLDKDECVTANRVLELLGAHPELQSSICVRSQDIDWRSECDHDGKEDDDGGLLFGSTALMRDVRKLLSGSPPRNEDATESRPPLVFYAGSEKLNPLPFFVVGHIAPGLVGGFMSALVHT